MKKADEDKKAEEAKKAEQLNEAKKVEEKKKFVGVTSPDQIKQSDVELNKIGEL